LGGRDGIGGDHARETYKISDHPQTAWSAKGCKRCWIERSGKDRKGATVYRVAKGA
jgi:hypothetical protein